MEKEEGARLLRAPSSDIANRSSQQQRPDFFAMGFFAVGFFAAVFFLATGFFVAIIFLLCVVVR
ncbi:MAG: hypothetical protein HZB84_03070 [Deltaproteobacteria bacterium]|nr:hypothetical protein [Deltaproteobacteria bacterium]